MLEAGIYHRIPQVAHIVGQVVANEGLAGFGDQSDNSLTCLEAVARPEDFGSLAAVQHQAQGLFIFFEQENLARFDFHVIHDQRERLVQDFIQLQ